MLVIAIKGKNHIINNFVVDPVGSFQPRGIISLEGIPVQGSVIQRNVLFVKDPRLRPFYLKNLIGTLDPHFSETQTDFNLYWHVSNPTWADQHLEASRAEGTEKHSLVADPLFRNPEQGDFRFKSGSPAARLGIQPLDLRKVGLRKQFRH